MKHYLFSTPILTLLNLQQPFEIEADAYDYVSGVVLIQQGHLVAYQGDMLSYTIQRYPTYYKELYSIVRDFRQWKKYILGKDTIIHVDHKPLQFIQTQGKLQNNRHHKWSTYLQKFHLNIKYKKGSTNHVVVYLSWPLVVSLTRVLNSCGCETYEWPQLYNSDLEFAATYQILMARKQVPVFHFQDAQLCYLGYLSVPQRKHAMLI